MVLCNKIDVEGAAENAQKIRNGQAVAWANRRPRLNDDKKIVAACDLLVPGVGEIIGGSQREERLDVLKARMEETGMNEDEYWWYLDLRKYGGVKHSGYGLGFERIVMYITGMNNIRDVLPFPRTPKTATF